MTDAKEKETPLFTDDQPSEEENGQKPADTAVAPEADTPAIPAEENPVDPPILPPTVDETYAPPQNIFEAIHRKEMSAVLTFLENKTNLASTDENDRTPLQIAAGIGALEIVKLLVDRGANTEAPGKDGRTPLMLALSDCHFEVAEYLLSKGVKVNIASSTNYTPLMQAAAKGATELVRTMLPKIDDMNVQNNEGRTALMIAVRFGHRDIIEMLLARNASLQTTDIHGNTVASLAETPDLKQYLAERADAERRMAEERKKGKEENVVEEVKKNAPSIFIVIGMVIIASAAGYFAYYQYKDLKTDRSVIPGHIKQAATAIAAAYCARSTECREGKEAFTKRCTDQTMPRFGLLLLEQGGEACDQNRIATCSNCLGSLGCDHTKNLKLDYLEKTCKSCFKACEKN